MLVTSMPPAQIASANNIPNVQETTNQEVLHGLDTRFERNDQGVPLSEREIKGLLYHEWIFFNFRLCLTVIFRTFLWLHNLIQLFKARDNITGETIRQLNSQGGIISKLLQAIGSSDALINNFFHIHRTHPNYAEVKRELRRAMHDNQQMSLSEFKKILDSNNLPYNREQLNEEYYRSDENNLGVGTVGQVTRVPMQDGTVKVVKVVNRDVEMRFLADISILGTILSIATCCTDAMGSGSKEALMGFLNSIPREFDLRYEKSYTAIQQARFDAIDEDPYNITEAADCRCDAEAHGVNADECRRYLTLRPDRPRHGINIENILNVPIEYRTPSTDATLSSRNMMVMEEINGVTMSADDADIERLVRLLLQSHYSLPDDVPIPDRDDWIAWFRGVVRQSACNGWEHGFFTGGECSGDIHDGNIMVAIIEGRIVIYLIDFGNYILESRDTVISVYTIISAIEKGVNAPDAIEAHANAILEAMRQFGIRTRDDIDWNSLRNDIVREIQNPENEGSVENISLKIFDAGFNHGLSVPPSISKLFRARLVL